MRSFATIALVCASSLLASPARGDDADGTDVVALSKRANGEYRDGKFAEAAADYERAYGLKDDPTLLFNMGRCYEALATRESFGKAVAAYEAYLKAAQSPPDAEALRRRIDSLKQQIEILRKKDEPAPVPSPVPTSPTIEHRASPPPWIVMGAGLIVVGAGGALGAAAAVRHSDAVDEPEGRAASDLQSESKGLSTGANVCFGVGGAVALAGFIWGVVDIAVGHPKRQLDVRLQPIAGPGFAGVAGSF